MSYEYLELLVPRGGRELPAVIAPVVARAAGEAVRKHLLEKKKKKRLTPLARLFYFFVFLVGPPELKYYWGKISTCLRGLTWSLAKGMLVIGSGASLLR